MLDMPTHLWVYRGRLERVVDGDTLDVTLDFGMHVSRVERLRLLGVNAPEMRTPTYAEGRAAQAWLVRFMEEAAKSGLKWPLVVNTEKSDSFGRYLAYVWRAVDCACVNERIVSEGFAVPYEG